MSRKTRRRSRSRKVQLPSGPVMADGGVLSEAHQLQLATAEALAASKSRRDRDRAAALARRVQAERAYDLEVKAVQVGIAETTRLALAREETVEVDEVTVGEWARDEHGALVREGGALVFLSQRVRRTRVSSRDGLAALHKAGSISDSELRSAMAIRLLAEQAELSMRSGLAEKSGSAAADVPSAALLRVYAGVRLRAVDSSVVYYTGERGLALLHRIACEGASLTSVSGSGGGRARNLALFRRALHAAQGPLWRPVKELLRGVRAKGVFE